MKITTKNRYTKVDEPAPLRENCQELDSVINDKNIHSTPNMMRNKKIS